ncbi:hypothetical protein [Streptomyces atratus]|nr:hypothetical protein [Streptomyces atratus]
MKEADATALFHDGCIAVASVIAGRMAEEAKVPARTRHYIEREAPRH